MTALAEPGTVPRASFEMLREGVNKRGERVTLARIGKGWIPAGAMMRQTDGFYRVRVDGGYLAPSGATFTREADAVARFLLWTGVTA